MSEGEAIIVPVPANIKSCLSKEYLATLELSELILKGIGMKIFNKEHKQSFWERLKTDWFYYISMVQIVECVIGEAFYIFLAFGNFDNFLEITELAPCIGYILLGLSKIYAIRMKRRTVENLITTLGNMWPKDEDIEQLQRNVKTKYIGTLVNITRYIVVAYTLLIWLFNLYPWGVMLHNYLVGNAVDKLFPYFVWYWFDVYASPYYEIAYVFQMWSGIISTVGIVGPDVLFTVSTSHICMLFEILQHELLNIIPEEGVRSERSKSIRLSEKALYDKLVVIIKKHQTLLSLAEDLENLYSFVILVNFSASSIIICLVGFQATAIKKSQLAKFVMFLLVSLSQVLMLCYYGNLMIDSSEGMSNAAYNCHWYSADLKFRRALSFLQLRAQKPMRVTALKFSVLCLRSFTSICSKSWSYFTLLKTIYDPNLKLVKKG